MGSHVISDENAISLQRVQKLCEFLALLNTKYEVILVSSGAISAGVVKSGIKKNSIINRQILAAIGQPYLMEIYNKFLGIHKIEVAQILLTASDFDSRKRTTNAKNVINALCKNEILPIINENDATAIDEIVYGDNDRLSASVANYFDADILVILSDIDGYYDDNPALNKSAKIRSQVSYLSDEELNQAPKAGSEFGTGGIVTKLKAANFLLENSKEMFLSSGFDLDVAKKFLMDGIQLGGTLFSRSANAILRHSN